MSKRLLWADAAKGLSLALVVLYHVTTKHWIHVEWELPWISVRFWDVFSARIEPLRMPLFFSMSGLFAARALTRSWRVTARPRIGNLYWVFALWLTFDTIFYNLAPAFDRTTAGSPSDFIAALLTAFSGPWYLYALALYFVVAKLTRAWPAGLVIALALVVQLLSQANIIPHVGNTDSIQQNFLWFVIGARIPSLISGIADRATWPRATALVAVFGLATLGLGYTGLDLIPGIKTLLSASAILAGISGFAVLSSSVPWVAQKLALVGRQTLPIYVMHGKLIAVVHWLLSGLAINLTVGLLPFFAMVYPALLTVVVIVVSLGIHRLILRAHAGWLFTLPQFRRRESMATAGETRS